MIRRRALWQAGAALVWPALARGGPQPGAAVALVWNDEVVAARGEDGLVRPLPSAPAAVPAVGRTGVWHATRSGLLQRWAWRHGPVASWQPRSETGLPAPAHALAAGDHGEVLVAHDGQLTLFDGEGRLLRRYEGQDLARSRRGRAVALRPLPHRRSLLVAWDGLREWWEISLDPAAPPVFDGYVHDHRMREAIASPGHLGVRRIPFDGPAPLAAFAPVGWPWVAATLGDEVHVVHLDVRRTVARFSAPGAQLAASAVHDGLWWLPVAGGLQGTDPRRWSPVRRRASPGDVSALAVAGGQLHALAGGTVWREAGTAWQAVAHEVGALAAAPDGTALFTAPAPWQGVAALAVGER